MQPAEAREEAPQLAGRRGGVDLVAHDTRHQLRRPEVDDLGLHVIGRGGAYSHAAVEHSNRTRDPPHSNLFETTSRLRSSKSSAPEVIRISSFFTHNISKVSLVSLGKREPFF